MKIEKSEIASKLAKLKSIIPAKPSIECLKGVLVKNGTLTAYNLEVALRCKVDCDQGEAYILPQRAIELIENLPDGEVEITSEEKGESTAVIITTETIANRFQTFPAGDYPEIPEVDEGAHTSISSDSLQEVIGSIMYAAGVNCTKTQMNGLYFDGDGESLNLVTCDGYRIAWAKLPHTEQMKMIVPRATVQSLLSMGLSGSVSIRYDQRQAIFQTEEYIMYSRLLEGEFVNYRKAFPNHTNNVVIDRRSFLDSIKRASICGEEKSRPMVILELEADYMTIKTKSSLGEYVESLKMDSSIEEKVRISFNARYLLDCIKSYSCVGLSCSFGGTKMPMVVDDGDVKALVLPVRISEEAAE